MSDSATICSHPSGGRSLIHDAAAMSEKIITLGASGCGKSCYMSAAMSYLARYQVYHFRDSSRALLELMDETQDQFTTGTWANKTFSVNEYTFTLPDTFWGVEMEWLLGRETFILRDWTGEAFEAINSENWSKLGVKQSEEFREDCCNADGILCFIDVGMMLCKNIFSKLTDKIKESFLSVPSRSEMLARWMCKVEHVLKCNRRKRAVAFVFTKSDIIDYKKVTDNDAEQLFAPNLRLMLYDFVEKIRRAGFRHRSFFATCLPVAQHACRNARGAIVPSPEWNIKDMGEDGPIRGKDKYKGQTAPIQWMIDQLR